MKIPSKGSTIEFYDGQNQFEVPFRMYADFELILEPIQGPSPDPTNHTQQRLTDIFLLVGALTASSLMETLRIH